MSQIAGHQLVKPRSGSRRVTENPMKLVKRLQTIDWCAWIRLHDRLRCSVISGRMTRPAHHVGLLASQTPDKRVISACSLEDGERRGAIRRRTDPVPSDRDHLRPIGSSTPLRPDPNWPGPSVEGSYVKRVGLDPTPSLRSRASHPPTGTARRETRAPHEMRRNAKNAHILMNLGIFLAAFLAR